MAKIWFTAQVLLPMWTHVQQLTSTCRWDIWQASIFPVPITTLQRPKHEGGWNLPNIEMKCKTLLYNRIQGLGTTDETVMAQLFNTWAIRAVLHKTPSPQAGRFAPQFDHLQQYTIDMAYIPIDTDSRHIFKKRIYGTLLQLTMNENPDSEMRIVRKYPAVYWKRIRRNIHNCGLSSTIKSTWYAAMNDILPTQDRLAEIHLVPRTSCPKCDAPVSVMHRITDCGDGPRQLTWTKQKLAIILRVDPKHKPKEWTTRPAIHLWPTQRHAAVVRILAPFVFYRLQNDRRLTLRDYMDFMKRAKWKLQQ